MKCPRCSSDKSAVIDSRGDGDSIRRRRECPECDFRFTTFERVELSMPLVVKKDGRREPYSREKLQAGLRRACEKRPVRTEVIDQTVDDIERRIAELCLKEIPSLQIGDFLMDALRLLDQIAYVRFASVYREFSDISQFVEALEALGLKSGRSKQVSRAVADDDVAQEG
jgi:transcriptional repressor NrdR